MSKRRVCPGCQEEFFSDKEEFHHLRRWGCKRLYDALTRHAAPVCACGCNEKVDISKREPSKFNKYVRGHNKKPKEQ